MKYCIKSRASKEILALADEIKVEARDWQQVTDLLIDYPNARIIIEIENITKTEWDYLKAINEKYPNRVTLCCWIWAEPLYGYNFYFHNFINTWEDLNAAVKLGVTEGLIGAPLFFQLDKIKKRYPNFKIRLRPNQPLSGLIYRKNNVHGTWVRPEDTDYYEPYVTTFEFASTNIEIEETIFNIYRRKEWRGNISTLIPQLDYKVNNQLIAKEIMPTRMFCGQVCESRGSCHICDNALRWEETVEKYRQQRQERRTVKPLPKDDN